MLAPRTARWALLGALIGTLVAEPALAKPKPREPGSEPGKPNESVRRNLTGEHPDHATGVKESPELEAMRKLDHELFPPKEAPPGSPWNTTLTLPDTGPKVDATGMPKNGRAPDEDESDPERAIPEWVTKLDKPDFPVRLEPSVIRYLKYYKNTKRGKRLVRSWIARSGRYRKKIAELLTQYELPTDLMWLCLIESAFDASIHSHAGAAGLWQFMPATGRIYGLTVNRRIDERLDPERSTHAALKHLEDLYKRFGTWELAFAAYNMGYGGLLVSIRRFNTNDYWELRRLEAGLPYETALYVPKIMAMALVANNCDVFGCDDVDLEEERRFGEEGAEKVSVAPGVTIDDVADAIDEDAEDIAALNPHVIGSRMPPLEQAATERTSWTVYVPDGKGEEATDELPNVASRRTLGTHRVRWGEPIDLIAAAYDTSVGYLEALNDLHPHESPRPGTTIFVPAGRDPKPAAAVAGELEPVAIVPDHRFAYADRRRVFYEPIFGDRPEDVARACGVSVAELRRWNHLDPNARLQEGMRLQLFVPKDADPKGVVLFEEENVEALTIETDDFFAHAVGRRGRERVEVTVKEGDSWRSIGRRYGVSLFELERINHRSRRSTLHPGDKVVVYAKRSRLEAARAEDEADETASAEGESTASSNREGAKSGAADSRESSASGKSAHAGRAEGPAR